MRRNIRYGAWALCAAIALNACTKFNWSNTEQYEIQSTQNLVVENSTDDHNFVVLNRDLNVAKETHHGPYYNDEEDAQGTESAFASHESDDRELSPTSDSEITEKETENSGDFDFTDLVETEDLASSHDGTPHSEPPFDETLIESEEAPSSETTTCIDLNTASEQQLTTLPGIGARRAKDILKRRAQKPFKRKSDIQRVKGIGPKTYRKMADRLCDL